MSDEMTETEAAAPEEPAKREKKRRSGPGFLFGVILGALAGAAAAALFAPGAGEEEAHRLGEEGSPAAEPLSTGAGPTGAEEPVERARAVLKRVRARMQEATAEGRAAAREAEEASRARFAELTGQEEPRL